VGVGDGVWVDVGVGVGLGFWLLWALQVALAPPPNPAQVQLQGPVPETTLSVPTEQRSVVGTEESVASSADPHTPLTGVGVAGGKVIPAKTTEASSRMTALKGWLPSWKMPTRTRPKSRVIVDPIFQTIV